MITALRNWLKREVKEIVAYHTRNCIRLNANLKLTLKPHAIILLYIVILVGIMRARGVPQGPVSGVSGSGWEPEVCSVA